MMLTFESIPVAELKRVLEEQRPLEPPPPGRISRRLKHFPLSPEVRVFPDDKEAHYILEIVAGDRPGLLAQIAYTLATAQINVAMERLALISAVALPITAVASVYGMNTIVNAHTRPVQLVLSLVSMSVLTAAMLIWARRQGWW